MNMHFRGFPSCRELEIFVMVKIAVYRPKRNIRSKKRIPGGQKLFFDNDSVYYCDCWFMCNIRFTYFIGHYCVGFYEQNGTNEQLGILNANAFRIVL